MLFEINKVGTEFYIILDGEVAFYTSANKEEMQDIKKVTSLIEKEEEVVTVTDKKRTKAAYSGVSKIEKIIDTTIKETEHGIYVFNEGKIFLKKAF